MYEPSRSQRDWLAKSVLFGTLLALTHTGQAATVPKITAQWDFEQGDLRASVGKDMQYGDGPTGRVKDHTSFGTTTSFGIPDIGGKPAKVMKYTRDEFTPDAADKNPRGYLVEHGIAPNGVDPLTARLRHQSQPIHHDRRYDDPRPAHGRRLQHGR